MTAATLTGPTADPTLPALYRVARRARETRDTYTVALVPAEDAPAPAFAPGQFNMLYAFGVGEAPISISGDPGSGDPGKGGSLVHTVRAVGAVTRAICGLKPGGVVGVRGPFGRGWTLAAAQGKDVMVVAGGLGLAPLRPAIYHILARRERFGRVSLLYGARSPADVLYARQMAGWRRAGLGVHLTVDQGTASWSGDVGLVTRLIPKASFDPGNTLALICGPEVMMRFTIAELEKLGLGRQQIYLSMERNMTCAVGFCGHCQFGPQFVCKDGPVFPYSQVAGLLRQREV